jgi:hypothetical protein
VLVAGGVTAGVLLMVGQATDRADRLLTSLQSPAARSIVLRASNPRGGALIPARAAQILADLDGVERAMAVAPTRTATIAAVTDYDVALGFVPTRVLKGPDPLTLVGGRQPARAGEALASASAAAILRMRFFTGTASVDGTVVPIVGIYRNIVAGAFGEYLDRSLVSLLPTDTTTYAGLILIVDSPADVPAVVGVIASVLGPGSADRFTVDYDPRAADVESTVAAAGRSNVRSTALLICGVGSLVLALVSFLNALLQRRELARRRALGHSANTVMATLLVEGALLSFVGALAGAGLAASATAIDGGAIRLGLVASAVGFFTLLGMASAIPGGAFGAFQDPARILRVP